MNIEKSLYAAEANIDKLYLIVNKLQADIDALKKDIIEHDISSPVFHPEMTVDNKKVYLERDCCICGERLSWYRPYQLPDANTKVYCKTCGYKAEIEIKKLCNSI